jgi:hypothetical protein
VTAKFDAPTTRRCRKCGKRKSLHGFRPLSGTKRNTTCDACRVPRPVLDYEFQGKEREYVVRAEKLEALRHALAVLDLYAEGQPLGLFQPGEYEKLRDEACEAWDFLSCKVVTVEYRGRIVAPSDAMTELVTALAERDHLSADQSCPDAVQRILNAVDQTLDAKAHRERIRELDETIVEQVEHLTRRAPLTIKKALPIARRLSESALAGIEETPRRARRVHETGSRAGKERGRKKRGSRSSPKS